MPPNEARTRSDDPFISLVVPVLDEEDCVDEFARRAREAAERAGVRYEILFIDDGSRDATPDRIARLRESDANVKTIRFTRSFGHQAALAAGLLYAGGDAVVTLDGTPPSCWASCSRTGVGAPMSCTHCAASRWRSAQAGSTASGGSSTT